MGQPSQALHVTHNDEFERLLHRDYSSLEGTLRGGRGLSVVASCDRPKLVADGDITDPPR